MGKALDMARELVKQLEEAEKKNKVRLSELKPGEVLKVGEHDFIVLDQDASSQTFQKALWQKMLCLTEIQKITTNLT